MEKTRINFDDQIFRNKLNSFILIVLIFIVFIVLGYVIGLVSSPGNFFIIMIFAIVISILYVLGGFYYSDRIALASVNARPADRNLHKQFYHSVEGLCLASGLPMPRLYVMENEQINAFATGRNPKNAVICVTTGALEKLNKQELEGVMAHELSHIANYDIRFMTMAAVMVGMIAIISQIFLRSLWFSGRERKDGKFGAILLLVGIILAILAPIFVNLVSLAISRKREYAADASGVKFTRYPPGLIGALKKIGNDKPMKVNKAVSSLFISSPERKNKDSLFSTHPSLNNRIKLLEKM